MHTDGLTLIRCQGNKDFYGSLTEEWEETALRPYDNVELSAFAELNCYFSGTNR